MLCSMCMHGANVAHLWVCPCGERHCGHIHECRCGTTRRMLTERGLPDGAGPMRADDELICMGCFTRETGTNFRVLRGPRGHMTLEHRNAAGEWQPEFPEGSRQHLSLLLNRVYHARKGRVDAIATTVHEVGEELARRIDEDVAAGHIDEHGQTRLGGILEALASIERALHRVYKRKDDDGT